eukprot:TRINITY_DN8181_c0_g1_i1.p1 TRINITY_DN8181_c0_g1~~TRINITY_DN8181_c0_g1_i1.p1  ORF type:complete len:53 (-),score=2.17 TRINITY_DN8181_c0_g1_i1:136-294(-)
MLFALCCSHFILDGVLLMSRSFIPQDNNRNIQPLINFKTSFLFHKGENFPNS